MMSCVGIGMVTGSIFLIVLLFVAGDIDTVINSSAPLLQILIHSTQNRAGAICLLMYVYFTLTVRKNCRLIASSGCLLSALHLPLSAS